MSANAKTMQLAPLSDEQTLQLQKLTDALDVQALHWLAGYAVGRAHALDASGQEQLALSLPAQPAISVDPQQRLVILYGSQTGNGQALAEQYAEQMQTLGVNVLLSNMQDYNIRKLKQERNLLLIVSTHGDGEPPDDAVDFIEQLDAKKAAKLNQLKYAVLALGDSSYPDFCVTGQRIDARLTELGGQRLAECAQADLDIDAVADPWWAGLQPALQQALSNHQTDDQISNNVTRLRPLPEQSQYTRKNPYQAELLTNQTITANPAEKDIRHVELDLGDSGLQYQPGDALGVWATNPKPIVDALLQTTELAGEQAISMDAEEHTLRDWLSSQREITLLSRPFLQAHAQRAKSSADRRAVEALLGDDQRRQLSRLFDTHQLIDVLQRWPADWTAQELVSELRALTPRMYSIASSQAVTEDEVHTTLARVAYQAHGSRHWGSASNYLADLDAGEAASVPIFIDSNPRFRLPDDSSRDIIMVGPGTGIAPFRAFVQHRAALGGAGRNWLFFGAQHFRSQFLYQLEWQRALKNNQLQRFDLAFSRDQQQKIYVQQRMLEQGKDLYDWLENGAYFYVCGDAKYMAKDVDAALHQIVAKHGGKSDQQAAEYLRNLSREKRILKDVY